METIKVRILSDGVTAKEVNKWDKPVRPLLEDYTKGIERPEEPEYDIAVESHFWANEAYISEAERWSEAESKLRTFEIERLVAKITSGKYTEDLSDYFEPNSIHTAEILEKGRIKIID